MEKSWNGIPYGLNWKMREVESGIPYGLNLFNLEKKYRNIIFYFWGRSLFLKKGHKMLIIKEMLNSTVLISSVYHKISLKPEGGKTSFYLGESTIVHRF